MGVACRLGAGSRRRMSRARERPASRSRLNDATAASYQSVANMRPAAPKKEMAVCSRSDTTSSAVGPSPKREELAGLRGGRPSPNRHPPSCRAHRARSARAETQRRKALEFRSPRNAVRRQHAARRDCVRWYQARPATASPHRFRRRSPPLGRDWLRRANSHRETRGGFDAAWPVPPFLTSAQRTTRQVTQDGVLRGTNHHAHRIGHRSRTVRCEHRQSVSGPGERTGYRQSSRVQRTGTEMVCIGTATYRHRTEVRTPGRLDARRDCSALAATLIEQNNSEPLAAARCWCAGWVCLGRQIRGAAALRGGATGGDSTATTAKTVPSRERCLRTIVCADFQVARTQLSRRWIARDSCRYREQPRQYLPRARARTIPASRPAAGPSCALSD